MLTILVYVELIPGYLHLQNYDFVGDAYTDIYISNLSKCKLSYAKMITVSSAVV